MICLVSHCLSRKNFLQIWHWWTSRAHTIFGHGVSCQLFWWQFFSKHCTYILHEKTIVTHETANIEGLTKIVSFSSILHTSFTNITFKFRLCWMNQQCMLSLISFVVYNFYSNLNTLPSTCLVRSEISYVFSHFFFNSYSCTH